MTEMTRAEIAADKLRRLNFMRLGAVDYDRNEYGEIVTTAVRDLTDKRVRPQDLHDYGSGPFTRLTLPQAPAVPAIIAFISDGVPFAVHSMVNARRDLPGWGRITWSACKRTGGHPNRCCVNRLIAAELGHRAVVEVYIKEGFEPFSDGYTDSLQEELLGLAAPPPPRRAGYAWSARRAQD